MTWKTIVKNICLFIIKVSIVILLIAAAFVVGVMLGYGVIGDGGDPMDVFDPTMWRHILDFFMT